ncbi:MAG TPA: UDP-glucose/GDP-mannose dehydrogenase family protein [Actinomycetota bacterium]|nr:UDP-glucose/GDP-mannose dehydrogenase family protein [Actinomycetota bacterium]
MRVAVYGTGHVGLITCVTMAEIGHEVCGTDADEEKVALLKDGKSPFYEPGLEDLLHKGLDNGRLEFTNDPEEVVADREVLFICVGTPPKASGKANLVAVEEVARDIARHATGPSVVAEKSTVPAGTSARVKRTLARERPDLAEHLNVVSNPEFLREGKAIEDSLTPERILVGADSEEGFAIMRRLYEPITNNGALLIETDIATAELAKHACNAFLAMKISFANALARISERAGADVVKIADVMGSDSRIGRAFLNAGLGYGGYCFPKDLQAFDRLAHQLGYDFALLREVARINEEAVQACHDKIEHALWNLEGKRIALLGLAFKPETDDVRLSPSLSLARKLLADGAHVVGYDPQALPNAKGEVPELEIANDPYEAAEGAHCLVIATDWKEFVELDMARIKSALAYPVIVDGRNIYDPKEMAALGFNYFPTGRNPVH